MAESIFELQAELFRTLGNATRLRVLHCLCEGPKSVAELVRATDLAQAKVSQHLAPLRAYGVVTAQRKGKGVVYRIANSKIARVCDLMREVLAEQANERSEIIRAMQKV